MLVLGLDLGSSSVKAGILRGGGRVVGKIARAEFATRYDGTRAEVDADQILRAVSRATRDLQSKSIDVVALSTMSPSWVAMDRRRRAITPVITHQDRRSVAIAHEIERHVGKRRHLRLAGNRPFPGGISSTTCAWFLRYERSLMRRADLVGHLTTYLHRRLTGARVTDPSHASFMGLYRTVDLRGWSDELCDAVRVSRRLLPDVREANEIAGALTRDGARLLGVRQGTPMLVGLTDTSAAMLLAGARPGQLLNVAGSTDVLALCTDTPVPHERLLTRALGVGRFWLSVSTLAAAGSALEWVKEKLFPDKTRHEFQNLLRTVARAEGPDNVVFEPYLAGDRTSMDQPMAAFRGLTLATTRRDMLAAVVDALARASRERFELIGQVNRVRIGRHVLASGGAARMMSGILRRDWKADYSHRFQQEATLRGLARLIPR